MERKLLNNMKKLQLALDLLSEESALQVLSKVSEYIDIIELGTPLVISEGVKLIRKIKDKFPKKIVFADIKIMDAGLLLSKLAFDAGADMVSVLAAAEDNTIRAAIDYARINSKSVLVDMCSINNIEERARQIDVMAPDYICLHVGYDKKDTGADPVKDLQKMKDIKSAKAIAGGINITNFNRAVNSSADLIIVGGGLYNEPSMGEIAQQMRAIIDQH